MSVSTLEILRHNPTSSQSDGRKRFLRLHPDKLYWVLVLFKNLTVDSVCDFVWQNEHGTEQLEQWLMKEMDSCISNIFLNEDQDAFTQLFNLILYERVNGIALTTSLSFIFLELLLFSLEGIHTFLNAYASTWMVIVNSVMMIYLFCQLYKSQVEKFLSGVFCLVYQSTVFSTEFPEMLSFYDMLYGFCDIVSMCFSLKMSNIVT